MLKKIKWPLCIVGIFAFLFCSAEGILRYNFYRKNINDARLLNILFYSIPIKRKPNTELSFRYYGPNAELLMSSDIKLNNLGLFSINNYQIEKKENEFRILVLGGEQTASSVANKSWPDHLEEHLNKIQNKRVFKVINLAWPDAGPEHYLKYWEEEGKKFKPDLVIVNYVETDFYRSINGAPLKYQGKDIDHSDIQYSVGPADQDIALTRTANIVGHPVVSYRDPNAIPGRPYGFFTSKTFMSNKERVAKLQRIIASDMIEGVKPNFGKLLINFLLKPGSSMPMVAEIRNFDLPTVNPSFSNEDLINFGVLNFGKLVEKIPNIIIIHNFHLYEAIDKTRYELTEGMLQHAHKIKVLDMRKLIPTQTSAEEIRSWYLYPYMSEKWSDKGHLVYGGLVSKVVLDWVEQHLSK